MVLPFHATKRSIAAFCNRLLLEVNGEGKERANRSMRKVTLLTISVLFQFPLAINEPDTLSPSFRRKGFAVRAQ